MSGEVFDFTEVTSGEGILTFKVTSSGPLDPSLVFQNESGGHRWQRIPPNEKRGRVHTSTVTVAVLSESKQAQFQIAPEDLIWRTTKGSGPGGQNRNKRENCVVLRHKPTGITVRVDSKSQAQNKERALEELTARLQAQHSEAQANNRNLNRQSQVGSGMRGDKVRTIRVRDDIVTDHQTGRRISFKKYLRGELP